MPAPGAFVSNPANHIPISLDVLCVWPAAAELKARNENEAEGAVGSDQAARRPGNAIRTYRFQS
jgi:hypothetical protein